MSKILTGDWNNTDPVRTVAGKAVSPDRAAVTGTSNAWANRLNGLIDMGFAAAGDRIYDTLSGVNTSVIQPQGSDRSVRTGYAPTSGNGSLFLIAGVALVAWLALK